MIFEELAVMTFQMQSQGPVDGIRRTENDQAHYRQQMADWEDRLTMFVYELVGRKRIAQFFDAVVEHPDSMPAIQVKLPESCLSIWHMHVT